MSDVLIDATRLLWRLAKGRLPTGIDRVCVAYMRRYGATARAVLKTGPLTAVLPASLSRELFALLQAPERGLARRTMPLIGWYALGGSRERIRNNSVLIDLGHTGFDTATYQDWLKRNNLRSIVMIHDLIPVTHPEYCRPRDSARHIRRVEGALRGANAIVTNSAATLKALNLFASNRGLTMPPVVAAPLAPCALDCVVSGLRPLRGPYFVMLSTIEPRKNHWMMLHIWRRLVESLGESAPRLIVIGQRGWENENVLDLLDRCDALRGFVYERADCSDTEMMNYLRHSEALLFPSFAEGYGLPLVEALSVGVPVIASDLPVFREIAGEVPEYLDPLDGMGWLACIKSYCDPDSTLRPAQLLRMRTFNPPTWNAHFAQFEQLLERVS